MNDKWKAEEYLRKVLDMVGIEFYERPNRFAMCCPFHDDRDPSSGFYLDTGLFHCFADDITVDVVGFYARFKEIPISEAERELSLAFGEPPQRIRVDPIELARARARGESTLKEVSSLLPMRDHAYLGEQLDRTLLFFERGYLDKEKLDKCLEIWYNSVLEARNAGTLKARTPILSFDARVPERMGRVSEPDGEGCQIDLD